MKLKLLFLLLTLALPLAPVHSAEFSFSNDQVEEKTIDVYLNSQNEKINALEGKIILPQALVGKMTIVNKNSEIGFWIIPPESQDKEIIEFAGIIPGGINSEKIYLFSLILKEPMMNKYLHQILLQDIHVLLHDGLGTETKSRFSSPYLNE